ncbi:CHASE domain-containing protein [Marinobacter sp. SS21]|uniref:CHASE domain-containing protein n=1 Tax=Marinobacter sp. SS21 TaxID=2979460 RepID=UPI00232DDD10|nr:CHASE domain-containing protein [Marinobacter sp. SS21]MDC0662287.1 CHASE domain-containing protein [Marinobacter sp. SS21]
MATLVQSENSKSRPIVRKLRDSIPVLVSLAILTSLLGVWGHHALERQELQAARERAAVLSELSVLRARIESYLNNELFRVKGLVALPILDDSVDPEVFAQVASELAGSDPNVLSLQLAKDGVVSHVWPFEQNKQALGHQLLEDPQRRLAAELAIDSRSLWVAGPVQLLQGGVALIGRYPIFTRARESESERFWGFATILVDWHAILESMSEPLEADTEFRFALRGLDGMSKAGEQIYGQPDVFASDPETMEITLPGGTWQLAAVRSRDGTEDATFYLEVLIYVTLVALLTFGLFVWGRRTWSLSEALLDAKRALVEVRAEQSSFIKHIPAPFACFDGSGKLVTMNDDFKAGFGSAGNRVESGMSARELYAEAIKAGVYPRVTDTPLGEGSLLAEKIHRFDIGRGVRDEALSDGRVMRSVLGRASNGSTALMLVDVTDLAVKYDRLVEAKDECLRQNRQFVNQLSRSLEESSSRLRKFIESRSTASEVQLKHWVDQAWSWNRQGKQLIDCELNQLPLEAHTFNVKKLIAELSNEAISLTGISGLTLSVGLDVGVNPEIYADERVLLNVLVQAIALVAESSFDDRIHLQLAVTDGGSASTLLFRIERVERLPLANHLPDLLKGGGSPGDAYEEPEAEAFRVSLLGGLARQLGAQLLVRSEGEQPVALEVLLTQSYVVVLDES